MTIYKPLLKQVLDVLPIHSRRVVRISYDSKTWTSLDLRFDSNEDCIYGDSVVNLIEYDKLFDCFNIYIDEVITNEWVR